MRIGYGIGLHLQTLGYQPGEQDKIVFNVQSELNMYTGDAKSAMRIWGWDPDSLRPEDHYRIDQLLRMYVFQRDQVLKALQRVEEEISAYVESDPRAEKELRDFTFSLQVRMGAIRVAFEGNGVEAYKARLSENEREYFPSSYKEFWLALANAQQSTGFPDVAGVIAFQHPAVARFLGVVPSLAMGGYSGEGVYFRLKGNGYPREWIKDDRLYDLIDMALALQAELQLQCLLTDREFTRIIQTRGREFEYLKAEAARKAAEESGSFWAGFGDVVGIVSAVAGVLALVPVLTPVAGPIAAVTAIASLGAHTVDASIKGDWDAMTVVGLTADALAALPGVGAVAKSVKAGSAAMKTIGTGARAATRASVVSRSAGRTFLAVTGGSAASEASAVFNYIGTKGAKVVRATEQSGKIAGKALQGSVNLSTQVPMVVEMAAGVDMSSPKNAASGAALTANYGQSIGSWGAVGTAAKKAGTVSLATFAKIIGRR